MAGTLFVVATPIGNLEDITIRALRVLRDVSIIAAEDTRHTARLLARHAIRTPTTSVHEHNEAGKTPALVARLQAGQDVAVVSDAGTPTISDPGRRLIAAAIGAGIRVEPIPGPSAVMTALAVSGLEGDQFVFLGFPPIRSNDRKQWMEKLRTSQGLVVFFEAPHRIRETLGDVQRVAGDCAVVVARELTKAHEELVRGPISSVISSSLLAKGEFTIVVDIGHTPDVNLVERPAPASLLDELGELTNNKRLSRRKAIGQLSRRHGIPPNDIYDAIEQAKKLVVRPT